MPVSGVTSYDVFVAVDGQPSALWQTLPVGTPTATFTANSSGHNYAFYSIARDVAGNIESKTPSIEAATYVADLTPPTTTVTNVSHDTATFTANCQGTDAGGSGLAFFYVYVQVDGGSSQQIGHLASGSPAGGGVYSASLAYQAIADGQQHTYRFYTIGVDGAGNTEAAPSDPNSDFVVTSTFGASPALGVTSFQVQKGSVERSFVRYLDLGFNQSVGIQALVDSIQDTANDRVQLIHYDLNGLNGQRVSLAGKAHTVDQVMAFDFGQNGVSGSPTSTAGDGWYELKLDLDGNGTYETVKHFYRLFGDVNGDRAVDNNDLADHCGGIWQDRQRPGLRSQW